MAEPQKEAHILAQINVRVEDSLERLLTPLWQETLEEIDCE